MMRIMQLCLSCLFAVGFMPGQHTLSSTIFGVVVKVLCVGGLRDGGKESDLLALKQFLQPLTLTI